MKIIFDEQETEITGYREIEANIDGFEFKTQLAVDGGQPVMTYALAALGKSPKIKAGA
jgi:hypothetical protein